jgi:drug/metabolite transporter (DMT)-like permease
MANVSQSKSPWLALVIVLSTVIIQILTASILKYTADNRVSLSELTIIAIVAGIIVLNIVRFGLWGTAHRQFPLSKTYPLTALFFPCVLVLSLLYGEQVTTNHLIGTATITAGVYILGIAKEGKQ